MNYNALNHCLHRKQLWNEFLVCWTTLILTASVLFQRFIDTHLCDASFMGYYVDYFAAGAASSSNYMLSKVPNHDYFIAHKGFFFDLDVWGDEAPNDDPSQPVGTDRTTLLLILQAAYE